MTDPISDMLTRIRNAAVLKKETVLIPYSKMKSEIAKILMEYGFIKSITKRGRKVKKFLELGLIFKDNFIKINGLKRISRQGQRIYIKSQEIFKTGRELIIISTPCGLMGSSEARKRKLGGEVICKVW